MFIGADDHLTDGYRRFENVSYPCFTTAGGRRVELREGVWNGAGYSQDLKLINVPVLKHHDSGGSEITACSEAYVRAAFHGSTATKASATTRVWARPAAR